MRRKPSEPTAGEAGDRESRFPLEPCPGLCIVIVSYGRPVDIGRCLASLARSRWRNFAVFICENAGGLAFERLCDELTDEGGPLEPIAAEAGGLDRSSGRLAAISRFRLRGTAVPVWVGAASENLGYGGGVNAWIERFRAEPGWEAVLVLNPDTDVDPDCLMELMAKAAEGYGMVGAALVSDHMPALISTYGLQWSRLTGRVVLVGHGLPAETEPSADLVMRLDAVSGACMLVTRAFIEEIGLMAEDYFLYMEDLDWGMRRGRQRIGIASRAVVRHVGGTAIGTAAGRRSASPLAVYLEARNLALYSRRHSRPLLLPLLLFTCLLFALRYLLGGAPSAARLTLCGLLDGFRGKTGRPDHLVPAADG